MTQARLNWDAELPSPATVNSLRDRAIEQVAQHAEEHRPGFTEAAGEVIVAHLTEHGPSSSEVLSLACKAAGVVPHDDRAFGAVFKTLARRGLIEIVGTVRRERGHGTTGGNLWNLTGR